MGDDFDNFGLAEAGSDVFGVSPSFNFAGSNSLDASLVGGLNYSLGIASGESEDTAGYNAASAANQAATTGISSLFGNSSAGTSSSPATTSPGSSAAATTVANVFTASTMTRVVAVVVGVIIVIGALYLFGSSAISDAIGNAVANVKGATS